MKSNRIFSPAKFATISLTLIVLFLLFSASLKSQAPVNFSGLWTFDKTKSTAGTNNSDYPGTLTREITQTASSLTYRDIYAKAGTNGYTTPDKVFKFDGKEDTDKSDPNVTLSKSLKWSEDKRSFTISFKTSYIDEGTTKEILINETYKLSDDGKTLTIDEIKKTEMGEFRTLNVYQKK
jgi:hypothetical protein